MAETISVIIPVYKVEAYLEGCVRSVQRQTYADLEIILVDDGSPDRCGEICDRLAGEDRRIRVLHQSNGGLSAARNSGLDSAAGAFVFFLDSDDALEPDCLQKLHDSLVREGADLALCSLRYTYETGEAASEPLPAQPGVYSGQQLLEQLCRGDSVTRVVAWNRLYRRALWEGLRFPAGKLFEDEYVAHEIYGRTKRAVVLPEGLYLYLKRESGITGSLSFTKMLAQTEPFYRRCLFLAKRQQEELRQLTGRRFMHYYMTALNAQRPKTPGERTLLKETAARGRESAVLRGLRPGLSEGLALCCPELWQRLKRIP